ncbi:PREDICTED: arylphorin subunit alpha-like [Ceratosolen solmsi marchali]|uniref:Arylphorin subunit alpha-like n=1 Tax=Ceratosolen solmsi marchali TaxID=326594 RepID=A0AAJ7E3B8_9HYME|nr:PREDICTED: arylphorin subunit alpha-like [Ceratosolen solmsi marchali]
MMRNCIVFVLLAVVTATAVNPARRYYSKTADLDFLHKQKKVFDLFMYAQQNALTDTEYFEIGRNYDVASNIDRYTNREAVIEFLTLYKTGTLSKDALFTYYNQEHREEMMLFYRLLYFAKDFATFYKTAAWGRIYLNFGLFYTAFSNAVFYRDDTKYISLPAIYEICPNAFFNSKVIYDAFHAKMSRGGHFHGYDVGMKHGESTDSMETYYVYSNFSDYEFYSNSYYGEEYKLAYFTENVDLNAYYYYSRMTYPFWVNTKEYNMASSIRGDFYYFFHKQLMNRYYLERSSNGFKHLEDFSWNKMYLPAYNSKIQYFNGVFMPSRDWWNFIPSYKSRYVEYIQKLEIRIYEAIDSGYFYDESGKQVSFNTPEGLNYLGNIIEGNYDSFNLKYYGSFDVLAREIFGMSFDSKYKNYNVPSSLQYFSTSIRDPAFYRLYAKILNFFYRYKSLLNRYTKSELEFSGVRFESVEVDKLYTYFENRDYYINNAVSVGSFKEGRSFNIKASQPVLNHRPFSYKFNINSDKDTKGVVRIFLGPAEFEGEKFDQYSYFINNYQYFFQLDEFEVNLKTGMNNFDRHSSDFFLYKSEYLTGDTYYRKVQKAIEGNEPFTYNERIWGFPSNMILPKGTPEGMRFKMFFYIGPYEEPKMFELPIFGKYNYYGKSLGFPLDRPMNPYFFQLDNLYFKDVFIYHSNDYDYKYTHQY